MGNALTCIAVTIRRAPREGAIEDMSSLLENVPREEVATKADISGKTSAPRTDTVQIVLRLIQNAFFKAILPGFEREFGSVKLKS